jgi:hypothetical protein
VRKSFGVGRASLGSLSEGVAAVDPEPLKEISQELFDQLPDVSAGRFDVVGQTLKAVDGSVVETLARVFYSLGNEPTEVGQAKTARMAVFSGTQPLGSRSEGAI